MKDEIAAAVIFLSRILKKNDNLTQEKIDKFSDCLTSILVVRFKNHWHDQKPTRGQGYRCLRVHEAEPRDPVLEDAAGACGLKYEDLKLPSEFTLWVDPREVCCRLGENRHASYCKVASFRDGSSENCAKAVDLDKVLEEHESARRSELNKFLQATSQRSRSPNTTSGGSSSSSGSWSGSSSPFQTHHYSQDMGVSIATHGVTNGGFYNDTVYYPPATTTSGGSSYTASSSWNHKWNSGNGNSNSRGSPPVANRDSPTATQNNTQSNGKQRGDKNSNGKNRVRSAVHNSQNNLSANQKSDRFHWVRHNGNPEVAKA